MDADDGGDGTAGQPSDDASPDIDEVFGTPDDGEDRAYAYRLQDYDPTKDREKVRGRVVYGLVTLWAFLIIGPLIAIWNGQDFSKMESFMTMVFGSVTTLVGSALGFYFGERKR